MKYIIWKIWNFILWEVDTLEKENWILCPVCRNKTRMRIQEEAVRIDREIC